MEQVERERQVVHQRRDEFRGVAAAEECSVNEVDAEHAQRLLLARGRRVHQVSMNDDLRRLVVRSRLEPDTKPAAPISRIVKAAGRDGVCKREEALRVAALRVQPLV